MIQPHLHSNTAETDSSTNTNLSAGSVVTGNGWMTSDQEARLIFYKYSCSPSHINKCSRSNKPVTILTCVDVSRFIFVPIRCSCQMLQDEVSVSGLKGPGFALGGRVVFCVGVCLCLGMRMTKSTVRDGAALPHLLAPRHPLLSGCCLFTLL